MYDNEYEKFKYFYQELLKPMANRWVENIQAGYYAVNGDNYIL